MVVFFVGSGRDGLFGELFGDGLLDHGLLEQLLRDRVCDDGLLGQLDRDRLGDDRFLGQLDGDLVGLDGLRGQLGGGILVTLGLGLERLDGKLLGDRLGDDGLLHQLDGQLVGDHGLLGQLDRDLLGRDGLGGQLDRIGVERERSRPRRARRLSDGGERLFREPQVRRQVHGLATVGARERLGAFLDALERQRQPAAVAVDLEDQDVDRIALRDDLARVLDVMLRELGDVDEALDARAGSRRTRRR